ncbi:hypothetical protein ACWDYH_36655 [Nocardia goodfellowii]
MDEEHSDSAVVIPLHKHTDLHRSPTDDTEPVTADARSGALTASFRIRYVHGAQAERTAERQARAIAALLRWLTDQDTPPGSDGRVVDLDTWGSEQGNAA